MIRNTRHTTSAKDTNITNACSRIIASIMAIFSETLMIVEVLRTPQFGEIFRGSIKILGKESGNPLEKQDTWTGYEGLPSLFPKMLMLPI
jgi:hypothetical protein